MKIGLFKLLLLVSLVFFSSLMSCQLSILTIHDNKATLQWIADGQAGNNPRDFQNYTAEMIELLNSQVTTELKLAHSIKKISAAIGIISVAIIALFLYFKPYYWQKYDGLCLLFFNFFLFICLILLLSQLFEPNFKKSQNARNDFSADITIAIIITNVLFQFLAYKINNFEIKLGWHKAKWISVFAILFMLFSAFIGLIALSFIFGKPMNWS